MVTIASTADVGTAARLRLPRCQFDYAEGGAFTEQTLYRSEADLGPTALRQQVLGDVTEIHLSTTLFGHRQPLPVALGLVDTAGTYRRPNGGTSNESRLPGTYRRSSGVSSPSGSRARNVAASIEGPGEQHQHVVA